MLSGSLGIPQEQPDISIWSIADTSHFSLPPTMPTILGDPCSSDELSSPSKRLCLRDMPIELLELLLSYIRHPADLLSLALCNHALYAIISPEYLQWHSISVPSTNCGIVSRLCDKGRSSLLVKRLIITDTWTTSGRGYRLCSDHSDDDVIKTDYELWEKCAAKLTEVQSLVLHVRNIGNWTTFLSIVTRASPALLNIALQHYLEANSWSLEKAECPTAVLDEVRDIKEFDWYSALGNGSSVFRTLTGMLSRNAETLRSIKLNISDDDADSTAFWSLRFSHLRSCRILNVRGSELAGPFLSAHQDLEVFHLHTANGSPFTVESGVLAKARDVDLRYFGHPELFIRLVQPLPNGRRRPLQSLSVCPQALGRQWGPVNALDIFCQNLAQIKTLNTLKWIELSHSLSQSRFLAPVARACPNVTDVVFAWHIPTTPSLKPLCDALAELPCLTTIRCPVTSFVEEAVLSQAEMLGRSCRTLQRVNKCVRVDDEWRIVQNGKVMWERVIL